MYTVGDRVLMPKFRPVIVTLNPPVVAVLKKLELEIVGGSKVKKSARVPITVLTVIATACVPVVSWNVVGAEVHATAVEDVQLVVAHESTSLYSCAVGEELYPPKLSPEIVTGEPAGWPESGVLRVGRLVITAASNVNPGTRVPTTAATVIRVSTFCPPPGGLEQIARVSEVQVVVRHTASFECIPWPICAVGVKSYGPKLSPVRESVTPAFPRPFSGE